MEIHRTLSGCGPSIFEHLKIPSSECTHQSESAQSAKLLQPIAGSHSLLCTHPLAICPNFSLVRLRHSMMSDGYRAPPFEDQNLRRCFNCGPGEFGGATIDRYTNLASARKKFMTVFRQQRYVSQQLQRHNAFQSVPPSATVRTAVLRFQYMCVREAGGLETSVHNFWTKFRLRKERRTCEKFYAKLANESVDGMRGSKKIAFLRRGKAGVGAEHVVGFAGSSGNRIIQTGRTFLPHTVRTAEKKRWQIFIFGVSVEG